MRLQWNLVTLPAPDGPMSAVSFPEGSEPVMPDRMQILRAGCLEKGFRFAARVISSVRSWNWMLKGGAVDLTAAGLFVNSGSTENDVSDGVVEPMSCMANMFSDSGCLDWDCMERGSCEGMDASFALDDLCQRARTTNMSAIIAAIEKMPPRKLCLELPCGQ